MLTSELVQSLCRGHGSEVQRRGRGGQGERDHSADLPIVMPSDKQKVVNKLCDDRIPATPNGLATVDEDRDQPLHHRLPTANGQNVIAMKH